MSTILFLIVILGMLAIFILFHPEEFGIQSNSTDIITNNNVLLSEYKITYTRISILLHINTHKLSISN
jgi:hypothetical protein